MLSIIISKTPYRISFAGGLSDLEEYYKHKNGCVISTTIDKYIYVIVTRSHTDKFRVTYKNVDSVYDINDIRHPIIRETLKYVGIDEPIEIVSLADTVGGSGLGSSSAFTVGLLNALYTFKDISFNRTKLVEDACKIEIDILKEPIGKQDQYATTYGGLNRLFFGNKGVRVNPIHIPLEDYLELQNNIMLFHTGITRNASDVLTEQKENYKNISKDVDELCWLAKCIYDDLLKGNIDKIGYYINEVWKIKKNTGKVSNTVIDSYYKRGIRAGAIGGKICGAGSGGYMMFYCKPEKQEKVRNELYDLYELDFNFEDDGTRIIYESS